MDRVLDEVFDRLDVDWNEFLGKEEMDVFGVLTEGAALGENEFQWLVTSFDSKAGVSLTRLGFKQSQMFIVQQLLKSCGVVIIESQQHVGASLGGYQGLPRGGSSSSGGGGGGGSGSGDGGNSGTGFCSGGIVAATVSVEQLNAGLGAVREDLRCLGYDGDSLELIAGRCLGLVMHSDVPFELRPMKFDPHMYEETLELPILAQAREQQFEDGKICLYIQKSGYFGVSFVVRNNSPQATLHFALDCSSSVNAMSHRGTLEVHDIIDPGDDKLLLHVMPADAGAEWAWGYSASYQWAS